MLCPAPLFLIGAQKREHWRGSCQRHGTAKHIKWSDFVLRVKWHEGIRAVMGGFQNTSLLLSVYFLFMCCVTLSLPSTCDLRRKFYLNEMHKSGDVALGGLFEVHYTSVFPKLTFTSEPQQPICTGWVSHTHTCRHAKSILHSHIEERKSLLPYLVVDWCVSNSVC